MIRETCLEFVKFDKFSQGLNFGCFWWSFLNSKPTCFTYQNLRMNFTNILSVLPTFQHPDFFVKEQYPKKKLFDMCDLTSWFVTRGHKEGEKYLGDIASLCINLSLKTVQFLPPIFGQLCEKLIFCFSPKYLGLPVLTKYFV